MSSTPEAVGHTPAPGAKAGIRGRLLNVVRGANIGHLVLIIFALHLFALSFPSSPSDSSIHVFDESYYVPASLDLLHGVASNPEHPFFGKIWGALGIGVFGNNFFGWRIFYAVIGTLAVWLMYELARQFFSKEKALMAASMLGFENLFFIHSSLLLLDGPPVLFALAGFLAYFKKRYYLSALAFGLCVLSKESGAFFVLALGLYHLWANGGRLRARVGHLGLRKVGVFAVLLFLVVGIPLWGYDLAYQPHSKTTVVVEPTVIVDPVANTTSTTTRTLTQKTGLLTNPLENFLFYYVYQSDLKGCGSTNAWNCYPWSWILPFNVSPLAYYVSSVTVSVTKDACPSPTTCGPETTVLVYHPIDWRGMGNLVVWYSIWLVCPLVAWRLVRRRASPVDTLAGSVIAGTYLPLFYISLVSQRVEYAFYFVNTDVGLALGIPLVVTFLARGRVRVERLLMALWLAAAVVFFLWYFPVNPFQFR